MCVFNLSISIVSIELIQVLTAVMVYYCAAFCVGHSHTSFATGGFTCYFLSFFVSALLTFFVLTCILLETHTDCAF